MEAHKIAKKVGKVKLSLVSLFPTIPPSTYAITILFSFAEKWSEYGHDTSITVSMDKCKFKKKPVITTSIGGEKSQWKVDGIAAIYNIEKDKFKYDVLATFFI